MPAVLTLLHTATAAACCMPTFSPRPRHQATQAAAQVRRPSKGYSSSSAAAAVRIPPSGRERVLIFHYSQAVAGLGWAGGEYKVSYEAGDAGKINSWPPLPTIPDISKANSDSSPRYQVSRINMDISYWEKHFDWDILVWCLREVNPGMRCTHLNTNCVI